jgi:hypothetical protein
MLGDGRLAGCGRRSEVLLINRVALKCMIQWLIMVLGYCSSSFSLIPNEEG